MRSFVSLLMQISHAQWILWNFTLHHKQCGYSCLQQRRDLLGKVDSLLDTPPEEEPEGSWHLLELDFLMLYNTTFERQLYWVLAMKAARQAGRRIVQSTQRKRGSIQRRAEAQRKLSHLRYDFTCNERQMRYELGLDPAPRRRPRPDPDGTKTPSNKRLQKPD